MSDTLLLLQHQIDSTEALSYAQTFIKNDKRILKNVSLKKLNEQFNLDFKELIILDIDLDIQLNLEYKITSFKDFKNKIKANYGLNFINSKRDLETLEVVEEFK